MIDDDVIVSCFSNSGLDISSQQMCLFSLHIIYAHTILNTNHLAIMYITICNMMTSCNINKILDLSKTKSLNGQHEHSK